MTSISSRRRFVKHAAIVLAGAHASPWLRLAAAAQTGTVIAETFAGKIRGAVAEDIKIFKGIPYGGTTSRQRTASCHRPNRRPGPARWSPSLWTQRAARHRECRAPGSLAPERGLPGAERLVAGPRRRREAARDGVAARRRIFPGSGSLPSVDGNSLARRRDVVVVAINHRLGVFGSTSSARSAGPDFALSEMCGHPRHRRGA